MFHCIAKTYLWRNFSLIFIFLCVIVILFDNNKQSTLILFKFNPVWQKEGTCEKIIITNRRKNCRFLWILVILWEQLFYVTPPDCCLCHLCNVYVRTSFLYSYWIWYLNGKLFIKKHWFKIYRRLSPNNSKIDSKFWSGSFEIPIIPQTSKSTTREPQVQRLSTCISLERLLNTLLKTFGDIAVRS